MMTDLIMYKHAQTHIKEEFALALCEVGEKIATTGELSDEDITEIKNFLDDLDTVKRRIDWETEWEEKRNKEKEEKEEE